MNVGVGRGIAFVPEIVTALYPRPGLVHLPVPDVSPEGTAPAWDRTHPSPIVEEFVESAVTALRRGPG